MRKDNIKRDFSGMELEGMDWINLVSFDKRGSKLCDVTGDGYFLDTLGDCYFLQDSAPWSKQMLAWYVQLLRITLRKAERWLLDSVNKGEERR